MESALILKFFFAFTFVISLMFGFAWVLKKMGLSGKSMLPNARRRLRIVEHLPLDHRRRLLLVRRDDRDHLIILGPNSETVVEANIPVTADSAAAAAPDTTAPADKEATYAQA